MTVLAGVRGAVLAFVVVLPWAPGCKQGKGDRCQVNADCVAGLAACSSGKTVAPPNPPPAP